MSVPKYVIEFAATCWFKPGGRSLVGSEIEGIHYIMHGGKRPGEQFHYLLNRLRSPDDNASLVLQDLTRSQKAGLVNPVVARLFAQLLREDREARERYRSLVGLWVQT